LASVPSRLASHAAVLPTALNGSSWVVCLKRHPEVLHSGPEGVRFTQEVRMHGIRRLDV